MFILKRIINIVPKRVSAVFYTVKAKLTNKDKLSFGPIQFYVLPTFFICYAKCYAKFV